LTGGQRHTNETTSELLGLTSRPSLLRFKKIKTPPPHEKKLNFYASRTNGTFGFAPTTQANPSGKTKRAIFCQRTVYIPYFVNLFLN
jgi:hypothetical protein